VEWLALIIKKPPLIFMSTFLIILSILVIVATMIITSKVMAKHPFYDKAPLALGSAKVLLSLTLLTFSITCVWRIIIETLDEMRNPDFWIPIFAVDPVWGELFSAAEEYDVDLGIPTTEITPDMQMMMNYVMLSYSNVCWCAIFGLIAYVLYIWGVFKMKKVVMWACLLIQGILFVFAVRSSGTGSIHIADWAMAGYFNPYNGDLSDSVMLPFFTFVAVAIVILLLARAYPFINDMFDGVESLYVKMQAVAQEKQRTDILTQTTDHIEKLVELKKMKDAGLITDEEFIHLKQKIVS